MKWMHTEQSFVITDLIDVKLLVSEVEGLAESLHKLNGDCVVTRVEWRID